MADFPALPLWTDAYLADTRHLSTLEHGAYLLLLMEAWRRPNCNLPDDDLLLSRLTGLSLDEWAAIKPMIMAMWKHNKKTKTFSQKKLTKERDFLSAKSKVQSNNAASRWNKRKKTHATAMPTTMPNVCQNDAPTPTPTPTPTVKKNIKKKPPAKILKPASVSQQVWDDFIDRRKQKSEPVSATVINAFTREAEKCGWTLEQAMTESILRGWRGFKAEWVDNRGRSDAKANNTINDKCNNGLLDACKE